MPSRVMLESVSSNTLLSFNIENIDALFPGFALGNFAVFNGSSAILSLSLLLCVRAQLPYQLGGLETSVIFIDGGNTFRLYDVSYIAQIHELNPRSVLEHVLISRAFTAYQLTSLIFDKLSDVVERYDSKLAIISDIVGMFLDKNVPDREAREVFNQLMLYLSEFAQKHRIIVVTTYPQRFPSKRDFFFKAAIHGHADLVASVTPSRYGQKFVLEKHPLFSLGSAYFPPRKLTLTKFLEA